MIVRRLPHILAVLLVALFFAEGFFTICRPVLNKVLSTVYQDRVPPLDGVVVPHEGPNISLSNVLHHRLQDATEQLFDSHLLQRAAIVRAFNQALWSLTADTYMANGSIIRGKKGTLFEQSYILAYCGLTSTSHTIAPSRGPQSLNAFENSNIEQNLPSADQGHAKQKSQPHSAAESPGLMSFVKRLHAAQKWFAARGQTLIYMLGEAKTTWYANRIPAEFPCPPDKSDPIYAPSLAALKAQNINLVDGRSVLEAARGVVHMDLYPRNGIHWNWLGAALATSAFIDEARMLGNTTLPALSYKVEVLPDEPPYSYDRDLSSLLNLLYPPKGAPSPLIRMHFPATPPRCTLVGVNDSFFSQPAELLQEGNIFRSVELYDYLTLGRQILPQPQRPFVPTSPGVFAPIFKADVIVLEEVETRVGGPYALMFLDLIEHEAKAGTAATRYVPSPGCRL